MTNNINSWEWDYYTWLNIFNSEEIKQINKFVEDNHSGLENPKLGANWKKVSTVKGISFGKIKPLVGGLIDTAISIAELDFGYTIFKPHNSIHLNHNIYRSDSKDNYDWHTDKSQKPTFDMKLTLLINLSEELYEGGEFQLLSTNKESTINEFSKPGSAFMFKSHILHRVLPVTSGTRKSLAFFINGPRFQ